MLIGYVRTSTVEQQAGFDAEIVELKKAGCERLFQEQVSSVAVRPELDAAIDFSREGDTLDAHVYQNVSIIRVKLDRSPHCGHNAVVLAGVKGASGDCPMAPSLAVVAPNGSIRCRLRLDHRDGHVRAISEPNIAEMAPGDLGMSLGVARIEGDGLLEVRNSPGDGVLSELIYLLQAPNEVIEGAEARWAGACDVLAGGLAQPAAVGRSEGPYDALGHIVHDSEEIIDMAVVTFHPHVSASSCLNQLGSYSNAITSTLHASF